ncbi:MAG: Rieske (2Fe-2S) protein [Planctomycetota bacterium]|nr:MAG: Rieske (2Fe-2S) protein [Planctomycetota bacterium]
MSEFVTVAKVGAIPEGEGATFTVGDRLVAVFLTDGKYHAIDDLCPHMGASLGEGHVEDGVVSCPWHAWRFRVSDGTWCDNPKLGVDCFEVRIEGDEIQVRVPPPAESADESEDASSDEASG